MTRFLFLKADRDSYKKVPGRPHSNTGIDARLLLLLSTRYV